MKHLTILITLTLLQSCTSLQDMRLFAGLKPSITLSRSEKCSINGFVLGGYSSGNTGYTSTTSYISSESSSYTCVKPADEFERCTSHVLSKFAKEAAFYNRNKHDYDQKGYEHVKGALLYARDKVVESCRKAANSNKYKNR